MIARLGDFLRLTIARTDEQIVSLKQEIDFVKRYLEIEQVRFERLTVDFDIDPAVLYAEVPHLILQPLVENAIRHAITPRAAPGVITISASQVDGSLRLQVLDNGPGLGSEPQVKEGVGLNNVRARLRQLYGQDFSFEMTNNEEGGLTVVLELPLDSASGSIANGDSYGSHNHTDVDR